MDEWPTRVDREAVNLEAATHAAGSVLESVVERLVPPAKKHITRSAKHITAVIHNPSTYVTVTILHAL